MLGLLNDLLAVLYFTAALGLMCFGFNCYVMVLLFRRRLRAAGREDAVMRERSATLLALADLPTVTTQIPIYNEYNVVERVVRAVAAMEYPAERHEIQILDDSTDETAELVETLATELGAAGHDIRVIRRRDRVGYKAGALAAGLGRARGEFVAIFDADFVPPPDYWRRILPYFLADARLGLVQARWGHLNRDESLLTRAQGIGIDGHFMVEQGARSWNGLFMNFNGTAGVWRRSAIVDAGGWEWDTLTEDMDLSYRMQLRGWHTKYVPALVVPAEIPESVAAFKSQQFRWAKGSIQTARKILPRIFAAKLPAFTKMEAVFHLTHYLVHPLMLTLALLALPVMLHLQLALPVPVYTLLALGLLLAMIAPTTLYVVSQQAAYRDWWRRLPVLPALIVVGVGIALSNSRAVLEALLGCPSAFVCTPKRGDREKKRYAPGPAWLGGLELLLGFYCAVSLQTYMVCGKYLIGPFLALYAAGFLFIGGLTLAQALWPQSGSFGKAGP